MIPYRDKLARLKYYLLEDLPYRAVSARVPEMRKELWKEISNLPALPQQNGHDVELHMLCGSRDAAMGIFASWSMLRFLDGKGKLYIHSDGSLTEEDVQRWADVTPGFTVVSKEEADQKVAAALKGKTEHLYRWRCEYGMSGQVVDAHLFGEAPKIVSMDSDVLVFHRPDPFITSASSNVMEYTWCRDFQNAYSAPKEVFRDAFHVEMPDLLNGGMMITPRFTEDTFQEIDDIMKTMRLDGRIDIDHYWSAQTYYAILAARLGRQNVMPSNYTIHKGRTRRSDVIRHYVGIPQMRYRFFTEGIPRLLKQIC